MYLKTDDCVGDEIVGVHVYLGIRLSHGIDRIQHSAHDEHLTDLLVRERQIPYELFFERFLVNLELKMLLNGFWNEKS